MEFRLARSCFRSQGYKMHGRAKILKTMVHLPFNPALRIFTGVAALVLIAIAPARAADIHWASATSGSWHLASHWTPPVVPGASDRAIIDVAGTSGYTVSITSPISVGQIVLGTTVVASPPKQILQVASNTTLNVGSSLGPSVVNRSAQLTMMGIFAGGDLHVYGLMNWPLGTMSGPGYTVVQPTGTLNLTGLAFTGSPTNTFRYLKRRVINNGYFGWGAGATEGRQVDLTISSGLVASITNNTSGIIDIQGSGSFVWDDTGTQPTVTNSGILRKSSDTSTIPFEKVRYNTNGDTEVKSGFLTVRGTGSTFTRTSALNPRAGFQVDAGAELDFDSNYTLDGAIMTGQGVVHLKSGNLSLTDPVDAVKFKMSGGALAGDSSLTVSQSLALDATKALTITSPLVTNRGLATWNGAQNIALGDQTLISNANTGIFEVEGSSRFTNKIGSARFINAGLLRKSRSTALSGFERVRCTNGGQIEVVTGTLKLGYQFVQTAGQIDMNGGHLEASDEFGQLRTMTLSGGRLIGSGNIKGHVSNNARIAPGHSPGQIVIQGNFTQNASGVLDMEIVGSAAGSFDTISVLGVAFLDGTMNVILVNPYVPPVGASFELIDAVLLEDNQFDTINGLGVGGGRFLVPSYANNTFSVGCNADTIAPTVAVTSPTSNGAYPSSANPPLSQTVGTAADSTGSNQSGVNTVSVALARYPNGTAGALQNGYLNWITSTFTFPYSSTVHESAAAGKTGWNRVIPTLPAGFYGIRATATDLAGNSTTTNWMRFSVPVYYSLSGKVSTSAGTGLAGVTVTRSGVTPNTTTTTDAGGNFNFNYVVAGNHLVAPTLAGNVFNPVSITASVLNANVGNLLFIALPTPAISGRITNSLGTPLGAVSITRSGGGSGSANVLSNANGYYGFGGVPVSATAYILTPTATPLGFTPATRNVTVSAATHYANNNFTATYSISGKATDSAGVGLAGVTVTRSGSGGAVSVITDTQGNYVFTGVLAAAAAYTITPAQTGYTFAPTSLAATVTNANVANISFVGLQGPSISGRVTTSAGAALVGVTVTRDGGVSAVSNVQGYFGFSQVLAAGVTSANFTLTPSLSGYFFHPANMTVTVTTSANASAYFIGLQGAAISGRVTNGLGGIAGVSLTRTGGVSVVTNLQGYYGFASVPVGPTYTITPTYSAGILAPASRSVTVNAVAHFSGNDFNATYSISGHVATSQGTAISSVAITLTQGATTIGTVNTNANGDYTIANVASSTTIYKVTPSRTDYTFTPAYINLAVQSSNRTGISFTGTPPPLASPALNPGWRTQRSGAANPDRK